MANRIELAEDGTAALPRKSFSTYISKPVVKVVLGVLLFLLGAGAFVGIADITTRKHELPPLSRVATLPHEAKLDPDHVDSRLILVGDVHGMHDELLKLLKKVDYNKHKDTLILLGDLITKGYDSLGVLDFAIDHGAYCVRGNHEDEIFSMYASKYHLEAPKTYPPFASKSTMIAGSEPTATLSATVGPDLKAAEATPTSLVKRSAEEDVSAEDDVSTEEDVSTEDNQIVVAEKERDMPLVKRLKKRHIEYLAACPAILELGQVSKRGIEAVAVHGGLLWNEHKLENQDIADVLRIRSIVPPDFTHGSEDPDDGEPWFDRWDSEQRSRPKNERYEVFYGHDASKGLQLRRYSKGLDTRCQRGGKLSAYVVRVGHSGRYHEDLVQIKC